MKKILIAILVLSLIPTIALAEASFEVISFSCSPSEVGVGSQFTCFANVQNTGASNGTLNTVTLYSDSENWMEYSSYSETVNEGVDSGASTEVSFNGLKSGKSGNNGFSKIMLDDVADSYVSDNAVKVNSIDVVTTSSATISSGADGESFTVSAQATVGGNADLTLAFSGTGCSIGSQESSATTNDMTNGQIMSHSWTVSIDGDDCTYTVTATATSNPLGATNEVDTSSDTILCTDCTSSSDDSSSSGGGGGGGAGGGGTSSNTSQRFVISILPSGETKTLTITKDLIPVKSIEITAAKNITSASLTVSKYDTLPEDISLSPEGIVYSYVTVTGINITDSDVLNSKFTFEVEKSWLTENSIDYTGVMFSFYNNEAWIDLPVTYVGETEDSYRFSADSEYIIATFAIRAESSPIPEKETVAEAIEEAVSDIIEKLKEHRGLTFGFLILIVLIFVVWLKSKKGFRKTK